MEMETFTVSPSDEFLSQIMEIRMDIDNHATDMTKLMEIKETNDKMIQETIQTLTNSFKSNDMESVEENIVKLKYLYMIRDACNDKIQ